MAKINNGILGGFSGKVGTVVGATWRDIDYMRAVAHPRRSPASSAELLQQAKMAIVSSFLRPLKSLLNIGFRDFARKKTGANAAQSYNMKNAVILKDNDVAILCSETLVCRGDLPNVKEAVAGPAEKGLVNFAWKDNTGLGKANAMDKAILVVVCHAYDGCIYTMEGGLRGDGAAVIPVSGYSGQEVQTWLSFLSKDGKDIAASIFTGQFVVA